MCTPRWRNKMHNSTIRNRKQIYIFLLLFLLVFPSGCGKAKKYNLVSSEETLLSDKEKSFLEIAGIDESSDINVSLYMHRYPGDLEDFKQYFSVDLLVDVPKDKIPLYLDGEYIYFFYYDEEQQEWIKVENTLTMTISDRIVLYPMEGVEMDVATTSGVPNLEDIKLPAMIRVLYKGLTQDENGEFNQRVGAFMDVRIVP